MYVVYLYLYKAKTVFIFFLNYICFYKLYFLTITIPKTTLLFKRLLTFLICKTQYYAIIIYVYTYII